MDLRREEEKPPQFGLHQNSGLCPRNGRHRHRHHVVLVVGACAAAGGCQYNTKKLTDRLTVCHIFYLLIEVFWCEEEVVEWNKVAFQQPHQQHQVNSICKLTRQQCQSLTTSSQSVKADLSWRTGVCDTCVSNSVTSRLSLFRCLFTNVIRVWKKYK